MKASLRRPTYIEVSLENIKENIQAVMQALPAETAVFSVLKANAYGHGVERIAPFLEPEVDGFCVSNLDEALELRSLGIEKEILVLGSIPLEFISEAIAHDIAVAVTTQEWIDSLRDAVGLKVHLKIDSGMGRVGVRGLSAVEEALLALETKGVIVEGLFTHFATADQTDVAQFQEQMQEFQSILSALPVLPKWLHASNSAASIWHKEAAFTMVRLGDVQFGLNPSGRVLESPLSLKAALSLSSALVQVKTLSTNQSIGYGATYVTQSEEIIGTVPIGYADGLTRNMQGFSVLVDGHLCPIVGRVSMDQITIRLPKVYPLGTQVVLIGQDQGKGISVQDWADYRETINYEIVCLLSDRIPRFYK